MLQANLSKCNCGHDNTIHTKVVLMKGKPKIAHMNGCVVCACNNFEPQTVYIKK